MSDKNMALLTSFLRVLGGCIVTAVTTVAALKGYMPFDFSADDWKAVGNSVFGALLVTAGNYFRKGETRFGRGSEDMGMGGEDTVTPPDGVIQTPDGPVEPPVEMANPDPQPVDEPVDEPVQPLVRSVPLDEVRREARRRAPRKKPPTL